MTHDDAIAILLGTSGGQPPDPERSARDRQAAEEHVARCSDCWTVLASAHQEAVGEAPADAGRMADLFGCESVRDRFFLLTDLSPAEMRAREPEAARHLGWCLGCRDRFVELLAVGHAAQVVGQPRLRQGISNQHDVFRVVLVALWGENHLPVSGNADRDRACGSQRRGSGENHRRKKRKAQFRDTDARGSGFRTRDRA